jgi:hypothetical protein
LRIDPLRDLGLRFVGQTFETGASSFFEGLFQTIQADDSMKSRALGN